MKRKLRENGKFRKGKLIGKTGKLPNPSLLNVFILALFATVLPYGNCILKKEFNSTEQCIAKYHTFTSDKGLTWWNRC